MDLFEAHRRDVLRKQAPLADRMRPQTLDEVLGQEHLLGPGALLRRAIQQDRLGSLILWGPPGSGKTTIARLIAQETAAHFTQLSAVSAGVADLRREVKDASDRLGMHGRRTILFIDEIHRFNRAQQDAILPFVEDGTITLIGATTENPSFEVNAPLLSRSRVVIVHPLSDAAIRALIQRALQDPQRGLGTTPLVLADDALELLVNLANGDGRFALNSLELAALGARDGIIRPEQVQEAVNQRQVVYDRSGDNHYDTISALHKSIRGSDPDAAVYWLARMLERGDDPLYVARRLIRAASEDVGLADPHALAVAVAAQQAVHVLGMPEGGLALAEAAIYLATAPKSNAVYRAHAAAREDVRQTRNEPVPLHLRNAPTGLMRDLGYGAGYRYAHDDPDAIVAQHYLPDNLVGRRYYEPTAHGREAEIRRSLDNVRKVLEQRMADEETRRDGDIQPEKTR